MAYVHSSNAVNSNNTQVSELACSLPANDSGDLCVVVLRSTYNTGTFQQKTGTTGWTLHDNTATGGNTYGIFYKFVGASEANPIFEEAGANTGFIDVTVTVVKGAHATPILTFTSVGGTSAKIFNLPTLDTTGTDDALVLVACSSTSWARTVVYPPEMTAYARAAISNNCMSAGWFQQQVGAVTPAIECIHDFTDTSEIGKVLIAIKDDGTGAIRGHVDTTTSPAELIQGCFLSHVTVTNVASTGSNLIPTLDGNTTNFNSSGTESTDPFNNLGDKPNVRNLVSNSATPDVLAGSFYNSTADLSDELISISIAPRSFDSSLPWTEGGRYFGLVSGSDAGAEVWKFEASDTNLRVKSGNFPYIIDTSMSSYESHGTFDVTDVTKWVYGIHRDSTSSSIFGYIYKLGTMSMVYGNSTNPCSFSDAARHAKTASLRTVQTQGGQANSQFYVSQNMQIGNNGTNFTHWDSSNQSIEFPAAYNVPSRFVHHQIDTGRLTCTILAGSSDVMTLNSSTYNMGDFHNFVLDSNVAISSSGLSVLNANVTLTDNGSTALGGVTFAGCNEINYAPTFDSSGGCNFNNCVETQAITVTSETDFEKFYNCSFNDNTNAIKITGNQTGSWADPSITVSGNTKDIEYTGTSDFEIQSANTLTVLNSGSGTLTIATPTFDLTVDSSETASQIHVYTTTTQTILDSESSAAQLVYTHADETVDITVLKDGFIPFRQVGVVLSGSVTITANLVASREYDSSHGLTYTTDASWASDVLTVPTFGVTGQGVFSLLMESFKTETALRNKAFNIEMDGANSLYLINDAEGASDANIENLIECGVQYLDPDNLITATWSGVKSVGTATGFTGEYQQVDGSGTADARATGVFNELIKVYGDASHGSFDYTDHLVLKYQPNGYREARSDILSDFGISALQPTLYITALQPQATGVATGDPAISITITDHTGAPLVVGGKSFDYEVVDNGANDGEAILRELSYNLSLDATYNGKDPFNWHEMVLLSGSTYESIYGPVEGVAGLHGVYVSRSSADHPDFTRHQSNDGTYYTKPITANGAISTIVSGSRVRIYNETTATETYNNVPGTSYSISYTEGSTYTSGDVISIYITQTATTTAQAEYSTTAIASSTGWSVIAAQVSDDVYDTNGIDGSTLTSRFTADHVNDEIDFATATNFTGPEIYAFYMYSLTTSAGITDFFGGITALDAGNYRNNSAVLGINLDNTTTTEVWQTDSSRIFRSDDARPVRNPTSGGGGIDVNWKNVVYVVTAGSGLSAGQAAELTQAAATSTFDPTVDVVEGSETYQESMRLMRAEAAGKVAVVGTTVTFRDAADSKDRITATVDATGQRTAITTDAS